jgi:hypothetical protein
LKKEDAGVAFRLNPEVAMRRIVFSLIALGLVTAPTAVVVHPEPAQAQSSCAASTPRAGTATRRDILNALRPRVEDGLGEDIEFMVDRIRVACGWARVIVRPQTPGGRGNHYEAIDAVLQRTGGNWRLRQIACTEVDCDPAADQYQRLYPNLPRSLLFL